MHYLMLSSQQHSEVGHFTGEETQARRVCQSCTFWPPDPCLASCINWFPAGFSQWEALADQRVRGSQKSGYFSPPPLICAPQTGHRNIPSAEAKGRPPVIQPPSKSGGFLIISGYLWPSLAPPSPSPGHQVPPLNPPLFPQFEPGV